MTREQLTEQTQSEGATDYAARDGDIQGLPPHLFGLVIKVKPGDAAALVTLLKQYPPYSERILAAASPQVGLSTIKQAQAMMPESTVGTAGSLGAVRPGGEFDLEGSSAVSPQVKRVTSEPEHMEELSGLDFGFQLTLPPALEARLNAMRPGDAQALCDLLVEHPEFTDTISIRARTNLGLETFKQACDLKQNRTDTSAATPKTSATDGGSDRGEAKPAQDAAWLSGAQAYNASHTQWVSKFLDIMKDPSFAIDGQVDAHKVADFQRTQGIGADGRVGPQTVAAAQKYMDAHPKNFGFE